MYSEKQLHRLRMIGPHIKELDKFIDWKKFNKEHGDNKTNMIKILIITFTEQEKFDSIKPNEKTELDLFLGKDL